MKKKEKKIINKAIKIQVCIFAGITSLYFIAGLFAGWGILFADIANKGRVAGASVSTLVRVFGPPSVPVVTVTSSCTAQKNPGIHLTWEVDENSIKYDVYKNGSELMLGLSKNFFDDANVNSNESYEYYIVGSGPEGSATSGISSIKAIECPSILDPSVAVKTFEGENAEGSVLIPQTTERKPSFQGVTNIPFAVIEIQIHGDETVFAQTRANAVGFWQWTCPTKLSYGQYTLRIKATGSNDASINASTTFTFKIKEVREEEKKKTKKKNDEVESSSLSTSNNFSVTKTSLDAKEKTFPQQSETKKPFDFTVELNNKVYVKGVSIAEQAYRGENLEIRTFFTDEVKEGQEIVLEYVLSSFDQRVLGEYADSVKINGSREIVRNISLPYNLDLGKYKIQVNATMADITVSHENYFILKDRPVIQIGGNVISYVDLISNFGWLVFVSLMILIFLILLVIWEHHLTQRVVTQITEKILKKKGLIN